MTAEAISPQASALNGLMDHWEERSKQPGVAGIAKYMAAFIRFQKSTFRNLGNLGNDCCSTMSRKKLGLHWVTDCEVQRAVSFLI